jgi:regulatory protein
MSVPEAADPVEQARDWLRQRTGGEPPEEVETHRRRERRLEVDERSSPAGDVPAGDVSAGDVSAGDVSGTAELDPDADPESIGRAILIRKLAAQDRTRHELASAMAAKNVPDEVAAGLLDRFEELGLVDDEAFAQRWVESRQTRRHRSRLALRRELSGKGVDRETVDGVLSTVSVEDELDAARAYAEKVSGSLSGLESVVRRRRLTDRLARRGFGFGVISRVLKDLDES